VPAVLARAGCPVGDSADVATLASDTVRWVRDVLPHLPPELLEVTLPDPGVIFRTWPLSARTRGAVARLGTPGRDQQLRVRDLVGAERFGPAALVDLLAALEENQRPPEGRPRSGPLPDIAPKDRPAPPLASRLDELGSLISARLPLRPEALGELLVATGFAAAPLDVDDVAKLFRAWEVPVPFRVVRRGGAHVLVAPTSLASADALVSAATQAIVHWGLASAKSVVERVRSQAATNLDTDAAARVLATMPGFRWLDETSGWFSFVDMSSGVTAALQRIFSVAARVPFSDLVRALAKSAPAIATAPHRVLERYLTEIAGYELRGGWIEPSSGFVPATLGRAEAVIVDLLQRGGGRLTRAALRAQAVPAGVPSRTLRDLIRKSPMVLADVRGLRLLGLGATATPARIAA
jgi:hypothetical protein